MVTTYVFLAFLLVYVGLAAFAPTGSKVSRGNFVLGNILVVAGLVLNWQAFRGTPPFRPLLIPIALLCGQLLYMAAVLATKLSIKEAVSAAVPSANIATTCRRSPLLIVQYCFMVTYEEFLWRATAQRFLEDMLANAPAAILVTACLFTLLHQKMLDHNMEKIEFLVFSVVLGLIYYLTASLLFVVLVHAVRDLNVKCRVPDSGGERPDLAPSHRARPEPAPGDASRRME
jgi:membrane protease YdiL (CAAX protease family)